MKTKVNVGIIGAGRIGRIHAENLIQRIRGTQVVAIADVMINSAQEVAQQLLIKQVTKDFNDIIHNEDIDAVIICSPTDTHTTIIKETAAAGKHIFCEKPIDLSIIKIKEALKVVEKAGIRLMVGFNRRFDPNFFKIRTMIKENKVGDLHLIRITSRDPEPPPPEYIKVSGGIFMDMAIHDFDMARYLVGNDVREVYAKGMVRIDPAIGDAGDYDTAITTLTFENQVICSIDNSRKAVYGYDQRVEAFGSGGMVSTDNTTIDNHYYLNENGRHAALPLHFFMDRYTQSYINEMQAFIDSIMNEKPLPVAGQDGLESVRIAQAAKISCQENRPVHMNEIGK
jgi:myo-inositol 2-dehydrogenase/D-chiro-inositol 1-dehydrogenase